VQGLCLVENMFEGLHLTIVGFGLVNDCLKCFKLDIVIDELV